jgi:hypothetical protein
METWDKILIYVISNKMDPESKQLCAQRIAAVEEPTYEMLITFLEKRQFEGESVPQTIFTHTQSQQTRTTKKTQVFHITMITTYPKCSETHPLYITFEN